MAAEHPLASRTSVSLEDLFDEPLVVPRLGRELVTEAVRRQAGTTGTTGRSQVRHMVSGAQMVLEMVRSRIGVALLSRAVFDEVGGRAEGLTALPLSPPLLLPLGLGVRSWDAASPVTRRFIEALIGGSD